MHDRLLRKAGRRRLVTAVQAAVGIALLVFAFYVDHLDRQVTRLFEGRRWAVPAQVYASPLELYPGLELTADQFEGGLRRLSYRAVDRPRRPGDYRRRSGRVDLVVRGFRYWDGLQPPRVLNVG
ncbi:MAG: penicillin-binding protein 1B, partial [bacterium]|nr:penicillin-binding protein 1B [bacterium]